MADTTTDTTTTDEARIAALEQQVADLQTMVKYLTAAVIDTARTTGYHLRHARLARHAIGLGFLQYRDFDT